jgi:hypothetical protein
MRFQHPPVLDEDASLGTRRTILSIVILLVFVLSFIPDPVKGVGLLNLLKGAPGAIG